MLFFLKNVLENDVLNLNIISPKCIHLSSYIPNSHIYSKYACTVENPDLILQTDSP